MKFSLLFMATMLTQVSFARTEALMCTAEAGYLLSPSGECTFFTDGCEKGDLLAKGFQYTDYQSCDPGSFPPPAQSTVEEFMGLSVDSNGITFRVFSGGCTRKDDFELTANLKAKPIELTLIRNVPDFCEAFIPYGVSIQYSWDEIGLVNGTEFTVMNKIGKLIYFDFQPQRIL